MITRLQLDFVGALESDAGSARNQQYPLVLDLVVPEIVGRALPSGHDAFNANRVGSQNFFDKLVLVAFGNTARKIESLQFILQSCEVFHRIVDRLGLQPYA